MRDAVLSDEHEIAFETEIGGGYGVWSVTGPSWEARMTNMRDVQATWPGSCGFRIEGDQAESFERLEVFVPQRTEAVLDIVYRIDGGDERLIGYTAGRWEQAFNIGPFRAPTAEIRKARALAALAC